MSEWVLLLGGSTGHGAATAKRLAKDGYGVIAFHFDRGEAKKIAEETINEVNELTNGRSHYFNTNAAASETIEKYLPQIKEITGKKPLKLLLHSIAFGTTTNFFGEKPVTQRQMDMTVHVMGNSILYWTQQLYNEELLAKGSRVIGLTSEGNYVAMEGYGPVSVASCYGSYHQANWMGTWTIWYYSECCPGRRNPHSCINENNRKLGDLGGEYQKTKPKLTKVL